MPPGVQIPVILWIVLVVGIAMVSLHQRVRALVKKATQELDLWQQQLEKRVDAATAETLVFRNLVAVPSPRPLCLGYLESLAAFDLDADDLVSCPNASAAAITMVHQIVCSGPAAVSPPPPLGSPHLRFHIRAVLQIATFMPSVTAGMAGPSVGAVVQEMAARRRNMKLASTQGRFESGKEETKALVRGMQQLEARISVVKADIEWVLQNLLARDSRLLGLGQLERQAAGNLGADDAVSCPSAGIAAVTMFTDMYAPVGQACGAAPPPSGDDGSERPSLPLPHCAVLQSATPMPWLASELAWHPAATLLQERKDKLRKLELDVLVAEVRLRMIRAWWPPSDRVSR